MNLGRCLVGEAIWTQGTVVLPGGIPTERDPLPALLFRSDFETLERPEESQEGECQLWEWKWKTGDMEVFAGCHFPIQFLRSSSLKNKPLAKYPAASQRAFRLR